MRKKTSRLIASAMLIAALIFFTYALNHPEAAFPWSNAITYGLYVVYGLVMLLLFAAPFKD